MKNKKYFKAKLFVLFVLTAVLVCVTAAAVGSKVISARRPERDVKLVDISDSAAAALDEAAPEVESTDYMTLIIEALAEGGVDEAKALNEKRDAKIDAGVGGTKIDVDELYILAKIVHHEAGSSWITEEHRRLVASVFVNRMASPEFPDTAEEVAFQPGQYVGAGNAYFEALIPWKWCVESASFVLQYGAVCPESVVFQAEGTQGSGIYTSIYDKGNDSTTYFCHSGRMDLYE